MPDARQPHTDQRLRLVLEEANDAFVAIDPSSTITAWNRRAEEMFGWTRAEVIGRLRLTETIIPERYRPAHLQGLRRYVEEGHHRVLFQPFEIEARRRDGSEIPVEITIWPIEEGGRLSFNAFIRDISDRREARENVELLAAVVSSSDDAIYTHTTALELTSWNRGAEELYGYAADEVLGEPVSVLIPRHRSGEERRILSEIVSGRAVTHYETEHLRRDGSVVDVSLSVSPVHDADGRVVAGAAIARDVGEARRAREALMEAYEHQRRAAEELEAADQMKSAFLRAVSHDLRSPLGAMLMATSILEQREPGLSDSGRHLLEVIRSNAERMNRTLLDLLDPDRLAAAIEPRRRPTDIRELTTRALQPVQEEADDLTIEVPDVVAAVDPVQLESVLENLVRNAVKHTPPGTPVWVRAERTPAGELLFTVEDAGPGVSEAEKHRLFQAYRRGTTGAPGHGLGLYLVAKFTEAHGGRVWVEDRPGGGARFRVLIPVHGP